MNKFERNRFITFKPQKEQLKENIRKLLSEGRINFDDNNFWKGDIDKNQVGISKEKDGIFFQPKVFLEQGFPFQYEGEKYMIYSFLLE